MPWWGRPRPPPRRTGSWPAWRWGKPSRAARSFGSCRPIPRGRAGGGPESSTGSSASARHRSRIGRGGRPSVRVGLLGLHGGRLDGVLSATRRALPRGVRMGAGPSRFCSRAAASGARPGRPVTVEPAAARRFLAPLPVGLLRSRPELLELPQVLERLGLRTLGALAGVGAAALSERFGHPGLLALDLSEGRDTPLVPRRPPEPVAERIELPEAVSGPQLERALELLVGRLLARPERRGRSLRALALSARFVEGGTWRTAVTLREASAEAARIRLVLAPRLAELPEPAATLRVEVEAFGPPAHDQRALLEDSRSAAATRQRRLGEAIHQARQAAGEDAALRVLDVDPGSRVPERRSVLAPYPAGGPRRRR